MPALLFKIQSHTSQQQRLINKLTNPPPPSDSSNKPNHIIIPSMLLDSDILEGSIKQQYKTLDSGIWRWPLASTPDKGGNTVLIGHRFTYTNPKGVFYHLDKVHPGDEIGLIWNHHKYFYKVKGIKVVNPDDTSIEENTDDSRLTLFTCTPLWLPKNRLVVIAKQERVKT